MWSAVSCLWPSAPGRRKRDPFARWKVKAENFFINQQVYAKSGAVRRGFSARLGHITTANGLAAARAAINHYGNIVVGLAGNLCRMGTR